MLPSHIIRQQGLRLTSQRKNILDTLSDSPQTVFEIKQRLKNQKINVDTATIYRTLDCFIKIGLVNTVIMDSNESYFELKSKTHHHHAVCDSCGIIRDVIFDEHLLIKTVSEIAGFNIQKHNFEFFGLCSKCRK